MDRLAALIRHAFDLLAAALAAASLAKILPPLAAAVSLIWTCIQIYEWRRKKQEEDGRRREGK